MYICPGSIKDFEVYVDTLQAQTKGDHPKISEDQLDKIKTVVIPILKFLFFETVNKIQETFSAVRQLIDQNTLKETPGLLEQFTKLEKETTDAVSQLGKLHLPPAAAAAAAAAAAPAAPAAAAPAAAAPAAAAAPEKPQEKEKMRRGKRFAEGVLEGEKEHKKPFLNVLSPLSKITAVPTLQDLPLTVGDTVYTVWTKEFGRSAPGESIINIQEKESYVRSSRENKIGICVKKTPEGIIVKSLFIDSNQSESKEIPDRWLGLVRDAISLITDLCT